MAQLKSVFQVNKAEVENLIKEKLLLGNNSLEEALAQSRVTSQTEAVLRMIGGDNVFLSGPAGSGKTKVISTFLEVMEILYKNGKQNNYRIAVTATTGIAATLIGGRTLHSVLGIPITNEKFVPSKDSFLRGENSIKEIKKIDTLIIDEVSMLSADLFIKVDEMMRYAKKDNRPFGGVQLIFSGDFLQLPPVITERTHSGLKFCFETPLWRELNLKHCYLDRIYRSKDYKLDYILDCIKTENTNEEVFKKYIQSIISDKPKENTSTLFTKNIDVQNFNNNSQAKNPNKLYHSYREDSYDRLMVLELLKKQNIQETLSFKKGDLVMITENKTVHGQIIYTNGQIGRIIDIELDNNEISGITLEDSHGKEYYVTRSTYELKEREWVQEEGVWKLKEHVLAWVKQLPLKLAYAITVHKSQGQTFDGITCDLSKIFTEGLGYVALSRALELNSITLLDLDERAFKINSKCKTFMDLVKSKKEIWDIENYWENLLDNIQASREGFRFIWDGFQPNRPKNKGKIPQKFILGEKTLDNLTFDISKLKEEFEELDRKQRAIKRKEELIKQLSELDLETLEKLSLLSMK